MAAAMQTVFLLLALCVALAQAGPASNPLCPATCLTPKCRQQCYFDTMRAWQSGWEKVAGGYNAAALEQAPLMLNASNFPYASENVKVYHSYSGFGTGRKFLGEAGFLQSLGIPTAATEPTANTTKILINNFHVNGTSAIMTRTAYYEYINIPEAGFVAPVTMVDQASFDKVNNTLVALWSTMVLNAELYKALGIDQLFANRTTVEQDLIPKMCIMLINACTEYPQFTNQTDCEAFMRSKPAIDPLASVQGDTLLCRTTRGIMSLYDAETYCPDTGKTSKACAQPISPYFQFQTFFKPATFSGNGRVISVDL